MNKIKELIKLFAIYKARTKAFPTIHVSPEARLFFGEYKKGFHIKLYYHE